MKDKILRQQSTAKVKPIYKLERYKHRRWCYYRAETIVATLKLTDSKRTHKQRKINIALVAGTPPVLFTEELIPSSRCWTKPKERTTLRLSFLSYDQPISAARVMFDILIIPAVTWTEPEDCPACSRASFVWNWEANEDVAPHIWPAFLRKGYFEAAMIQFQKGSEPVIKWFVWLRSARTSERYLNQSLWQHLHLASRKILRHFHLSPPPLCLLWPPSPSLQRKAADCKSKLKKDFKHIDKLSKSKARLLLLSGRSLLGQEPHLQTPTAEKHRETYSERPRRQRS